MTLDDLITETDPTVALAARKVARQFAGFTEFDDLVQEMRVWIIKHHQKVVSWIEDADEDERKAWDKKLFVTLMRVGGAYARGEKAAISGYRPEDEWFANRKVIRELLPVVLAGGEDGYEAKVQSETASGGDPAEGNNRAAMLADIDAAYRALTQDFVLLSDIYKWGVTYKELADEFEVSETTVRNRERRAIDKMIEHLGGTDPSRF